MQIYSRKDRFSILLCCMLLIGFLGASVISYLASAQSIRASISTQQLPLTGDNVYSELQKDIIRPIHLSASMAQNTFLRDWLSDGEREPEKITRYLKEIKDKNNIVTAFLVSESSRRYYHAGGLLKTVHELDPRDRWYYRVRKMNDAYETNVDPDLANMDKTTVFINYRVKDNSGKFIGAAGVGLTLENVREKIDFYEQRFGGKVFFVDRTGRITMASSDSRKNGGSILGAQGIGTIANKILRSSDQEQQLEYEQEDGSSVQVNARFIPELNWHLILEKNDSDAISPFRKILFMNIGVSLVALFAILMIVMPAFRNYQRKLNDAAYKDSLTGLLNRQGLTNYSKRILGEFGVSERQCSVVYFDIDNFKSINDTYGHAAGDTVLSKVASLSSAVLRPYDQNSRWGGEEFVVILPDCGLNEAAVIADRIRSSIADHDFPMLEGNVTVSLGVAERRDNESLDKLLYQADTALYAAKTQGKNRVVKAFCNADFASTVISTAMVSASGASP